MALGPPVSDWGLMCSCAYRCFWAVVILLALTLFLLASLLHVDVTVLLP